MAESPTRRPPGRRQRATSDRAACGRSKQWRLLKQRQRSKLASLKGSDSVGLDELDLAEAAPLGDPARAAEHPAREVGGDVADPLAQAKGAEREPAAAGGVEDGRAVRHLRHDRHGTVEEPRVRTKDEQAEHTCQRLALDGEVVERRPGPVIPAASPDSPGLGHALSTLVPLVGISAADVQVAPHAPSSEVGGGGGSGRLKRFAGSARSCRSSSSSG
jgi:hypothetical protein